MPVYIEEELLASELIYINGGRRGYLLAIDPHVVLSALNAVKVKVGIAR